jgi:hypothetical protein
VTTRIGTTDCDFPVFPLFLPPHADAASANANKRTTITFSLFPFFTFSLFHYSLFPVHCSLTKNALFFYRRIIDKKNKAFLKNKKSSSACDVLTRNINLAITTEAGVLTLKLIVSSQ